MTAAAATATATAPVATTGRATDLVPGVSARLHRIARLTSLTVLPSCVWRLLIALGIPMGWGPGSDLHHSHYPGPASLVLLLVCVLQEAAGLLALGLVQRWGEQVPRWLPVLGGRRIPPVVALVPAALGALAVTGITLLGAWVWNDTNAANPDAPTGFFGGLFALAYAPLLLWGPLLGVLTVAYRRRRRAHG
ncbi:hypothetical protein [Streptomyces sp. NPDC089799]|uniref:hypothetical protein n=1 Tax=Streptomyces sp. NPDC089799 TaxID=3155066 RepID=UPI00342573A0